VTHTTYVSQTLRIPAATVTEKLTLVGPVPGRPTGLFMVGYEDDIWIFTVFGLSGRQPPHDLTGMLAFARDYAPAHVVAAVRAAQPVTAVVQHRLPSSQWRRYDKMKRFPDGLLVTGDAMCSFNPIYGQGMSVAAMDALALQKSLRDGVGDLPRRYFRAAAKSIGVAWAMAAGSDLAFPDVEGRRTPATRLTRHFSEWVLTACETDVVVLRQFTRVSGLLDPPVRFVHPAFLARVARANRRRHHEARTRQRLDAKIGA
jgi:2-polyprenyl-6-methoxyphenol hydroxylase-like FAD-dependent oxidoreductase